MTARAAPPSNRPAPQLDPPWYAGGRDQLVPAVELAGGHAVVCPSCAGGVHTHAADGHHAPGCNGPRARYLVRGLSPAAYVELLLHRLGFQPEQVSEIMRDIARAHALRSHPGPQTPGAATKTSRPSFEAPRSS